MPDLLSQIKFSLRRIDALVPNKKYVKDYLQSILEEVITSISSDNPPMGIVPVSNSLLTKIFASASMAVELIETPEKLVEKPDILNDIGIIEWLLRPALLLKNGLIESPGSGLWQQLKSDLVEAPSKSVCRIDLCMDGYTPIHLGTGFVIGTNVNDQFVVMTNAHVIEGAIKNGWSDREGIDLACDFTRETVAISDRLFPLEAVYHIHPHYDLALVYLSRERLESTGVFLTPLKIAEKSPDNTLELEVGVIGHPSFDSNRDPFPKYFGFGNEFGVKRFSPGLIRSIENRNWRSQDVEVFLHDATTLSGSSGSCILDLKNMNVVGLHFGGWPMQRQKMEIADKDVMAQLFHANGAVPLWLLGKDPLLQQVTLTSS
jgi:Trypsin-like peptidase domain